MRTGAHAHTHAHSTWANSVKFKPPKRCEYGQMVARMLSVRAWPGGAKFSVGGVRTPSAPVAPCISALPRQFDARLSRARRRRVTARGTLCVGPRAGVAHRAASVGSDALARMAAAASCGSESESCSRCRLEDGATAAAPSGGCIAGKSGLSTCHRGV